jgi:hypothetical protein
MTIGQSLTEVLKVHHVVDRNRRVAGIPADAVPGEGLRHHEGAGEVHAEHPVPGFGGHLEQGRLRHDASRVVVLSIVDQNHYRVPAGRLARAGRAEHLMERSS